MYLRSRGLVQNYGLYQTSLLISASPYVLFIGGEVGRTRQKLSYSGKLIKQWFTRRIRAISRTLQIEHTATLVLIPQPYDVRRVGFKESEPAPPINHGSRTLLALPNISLVLKKEVCPFCITWGKSWVRPVLNIRQHVVAGSDLISGWQHGSWYTANVIDESSDCV